MGWRWGLEVSARQAARFYGVIVFSMLVALGLGFTRINPIKALFYSAVINGVVAVPLIVLILLLAARTSVLGPYRARGMLLGLGWMAAAVMALSVAGMLMPFAEVRISGHRLARRRLMPLHLHAVISPEEATTHRHQLAVGRMVDRFDPGNALGDFRMRALDVRHQLFLGARRTGNENGARILQGQGNALEVCRIHRDVAAVSGVHFVMQVFLAVRAVDNRGISAVGIEADDPGQLVIDPHQDVKMFPYFNLRFRLNKNSPNSTRAWVAVFHAASRGRLPQVSRYPAVCL